MIPPPIDAPVMIQPQKQQYDSYASLPLQQGVRHYYYGATSSSSSSASSSFLADRSSTMTVALKDRVIPTQEEIDAKKFNFNLIFWGGGIVAPFLATIFYFGARFWEK
jgi:hypothetical protein